MTVAWKPQARRTCVLAAFAALAILATPAGNAQSSGKAALYAGLGDTLTQYELDIEQATLAKRSAVTLPGNVGEGWVHPSNRYLYVPWSNGARPVGDRYGVSAFRIDPASGALTPVGEPARLPANASNVTGDLPGTHLLIASQKGVTVYRIGPDGAVGSQVEQSGVMDAGIVQHQVRISPSNKVVILVTRGNYTDEQYPNFESRGPLKILQPGALKVFGYKDGKLTNEVSMAEGNGFGFQARHLDFHPSLPWIFLTLEPQNKLLVYRELADATLSTHPLFAKETLADPGNVRPMQHAGTIHVHPGGNTVYVANRTNGTMDFGGTQVFGGGENSIAVYGINQRTGEPTLIQNEDTRGVLPRTFSLDSSGRILVVANQTALNVRDGQNVRMLPSSLAVFRVLDDGRLSYARKYDLDTAGQSMTWRSPQGFTVGQTLSCFAIVSLPQ